MQLKDERRTQVEVETVAALLEWGLFEGNALSLGEVERDRCAGSAAALQLARGSPIGEDIDHVNGAADIGGRHSGAGGCDGGGTLAANLAINDGDHGLDGRVDIAAIEGDGAVGPEEVGLGRRLRDGRAKGDERQKENEQPPGDPPVADQGLLAEVHRHGGVSLSHPWRHGEGCCAR